MTTYTITTRVVKGGRAAMRDSKIYSLLCDDDGRSRMVDSFRAFTKAKDYAARIGTNGDVLIVDGKRMTLRNQVWAVAE
jgi:hypothetical protein